MFNNQTTIKYVIEIDEAYWSNRWQKWSTFTDAQKQENRKLALKELDEFLLGNKNAYKSLITGTKLTLSPAKASLISLSRLSMIR